MLSTVGQRLSLLLRSQDYTITSFARKLRMRWHRVRDLIDGNTEMHLADLQAVSRTFNLTSDESCWLANPLIPGATPPSWIKVDILEGYTIGDVLEMAHTVKYPQNKQTHTNPPSDD